MRRLYREGRTRLGTGDALLSCVHGMQQPNDVGGRRSTFLLRRRGNERMVTSMAAATTRME